MPPCQLLSLLLHHAAYWMWDCVLLQVPPLFGPLWPQMRPEFSSWGPDLVTEVPGGPWGFVASQAGEQGLSEFRFTQCPHISALHRSSFPSSLETCAGLPDAWLPCLLLSAHCVVASGSGRCMWLSEKPTLGCSLYPTSDSSGKDPLFVPASLGSPTWARPCKPWKWGGPCVIWSLWHCGG